MSYHANEFKVKSVKLVLPIGFRIENFIQEHTGNPNAPRILVESNLRDWFFNQDGEGLTMEGSVTKKGFEVAKLTCAGEGSGHHYDDVLKPLFERFKGELKATVIWDSGEVVRVTIKQGKVTEKDVAV